MIRQRGMKKFSPLTVVALSIALLAGACGAGSVETGSPQTTTSEPPTTSAPDNPHEASLNDARERWEASGIKNYELTYQIQCFCPQIIRQVTVVDGLVTNVVDEGETLGNLEALTVDDLFANLRAAIDDRAFNIQVNYDPDAGYPLSYFIDFEEMMADEEQGISVISLVVE